MERMFWNVLSPSVHGKWEHNQEEHTRLSHKKSTNKDELLVPHMISKKQFILDENVLIFAQTGTNDRGEPDETCSNLVSSIIRICHTIVIDVALYGKYLRQLNQYRHQPTGLGTPILPLLSGATRVTGKYDRFDRDSAPPFEGEEAIPQGSQDDVPVSVRLAVETGATLVTTDGPLREHLESSGIQTRYNLEIVSPEDALASL